MQSEWLIPQLEEDESFQLVQDRAHRHFGTTKLEITWMNICQETMN